MVYLSEENAMYADIEIVWPTFPTLERFYNPKQPGYLVEVLTDLDKEESHIIVPRHKV